MKKPKDELAKLKETLHRYEKEIAELKGNVEILRGERDAARALLETKSAELRDAHTYLSKVDDVSDNEVLDIVAQINSRIFQTAAGIADLFRGRYESRWAAGAVASVGTPLLQSGLVGHDLYAALLSCDHCDDTIVVQMALQTVMVSYMKWLCTTWDFQVGSSCALQQIHDKIKESGTYY